MFNLKLIIMETYQVVSALKNIEVVKWQVYEASSGFKLAVRNSEIIIPIEKINKIEDREHVVEITIDEWVIMIWKRVDGIFITCTSY